MENKNKNEQGVVREKKCVGGVTEKNKICGVVSEIIKGEDVVHEKNKGCRCGWETTHSTPWGKKME